MAVTGHRYHSTRDGGDPADPLIDFEGTGTVGRPKLAVLRERPTRRQEQRQRHRYWLGQFEDGISVEQIVRDSGFSPAAVYYGIRNAMRLERLKRQRV